jgi:protein-arginine kinase activator protein McsA
VIERAHGGATEHVGSAPTRADDARQRAALLQKLLRELEQAISAEQYEHAADLRDKIKDLRPTAAAGDKDCAP